MANAINFILFRENMGSVVASTTFSPLSGRRTETLRPRKDSELEGSQAARSMEEQSFTGQE